MDEEPHVPPVRSEPERLRAFDERVRVPLILLGLVFVAAYSVNVIAVDLPRPARAGILALLVIVWIALAAEYVVRLALVPRGGRWRWAIGHPLDLLSVVLPVVRALRVVDLIRVTAGTRGGRVRLQIGVYAGAYAVTFVYFLALATLSAERGARGATITSFGDALWWACETLSTVGYGDLYPVTVGGRVCAVVLMAGGIVIVGVVTGTVVSYISERIREAARRER